MKSSYNSTKEEEEEEEEEEEAPESAAESVGCPLISICTDTEYRQCEKMSVVVHVNGDLEFMEKGQSMYEIRKSQLMRLYWGVKSRKVRLDFAVQDIDDHYHKIDLEFHTEFYGAIFVNLCDCRKVKRPRYVIDALEGIRSSYAYKILVAT